MVSCIGVSYEATTCSDCSALIGSCEPWFFSFWGGGGGGGGSLYCKLCMFCSYMHIHTLNAHTSTYIEHTLTHRTKNQMHTRTMIREN